METLVTIRNRCSLKAHISGREVEPEKINIILEAGRLAASDGNKQPWRFIVVQEKQLVEELSQAFKEYNRVIKDAPVILFTCVRAVDELIRDGRDYYLFDIGLAVGNMLLAATDMGLVTHLMTAFNAAQIKQILQLPDDIRVVVATPLAYPLEGSYYEAARERLSKRTRKDLKELVHYNRWNTAEPAK